MTGVTDENGARVTTYGSDLEGRAIETKAAGGVDHYKVAYGLPPEQTVLDTYNIDLGFVVREHLWLQPENTVVTLPNGEAISLSASVVRGSTRLTGSSQPAGSGCAAAVSAQAYDERGNISQRDDFNQQRSCFAYDGRNRELVQVEGLSTADTCSRYLEANVALPAGTRKRSTEWHPHWRFAVKRAEPGRIVSYIYNGQQDPFNSNSTAACAPGGALPDGKPIAVVCKRVEQATTDADGALGFSAPLQAGVPPRETSWTYNQFGQVLTEDGPRTDVADITTYEYYMDTTADHMPGDLKQVTNAAGTVTQYTKYNQHGQVLESVDANNVLTVNTYDLRQRLLSSSVGGQTTSYSYDPVGQLKRITLPDTSWIGYDYDDAHRQVAVYDHKGNRITYTLDNAGNRTGEDVKDPGGVLKRQLTRTIDALGRVQQTKAGV